MDVDPTGNGTGDATNYWSSYYQYPYNTGVDPNQQYYVGYPGWGTGPAIPGFQPPPPSQPPPPPPDDDQPPPPPSDAKPPSPKRPKTASSDSDKLPKNFPPPPPGLMPGAMPPLPEAEKDKYGYYDSTSSNTATASAWDTSSYQNQTKDAGNLTRTFAQVVQSGSCTSAASAQNSHSNKLGNNYQNNKRPYPDSTNQDRSKFHSNGKGSGYDRPKPNFYGSSNNAYPDNSNQHSSGPPPGFSPRGKDAKRDPDRDDKNRRYSDHPQSGNSRYNDREPANSDRYNDRDPGNSERYNDRDPGNSERYNDREGSNSDRYNDRNPGNSERYNDRDPSNSDRYNDHRNNSRYNDNQGRYDDRANKTPQGKDTKRGEPDQDKNRRYSESGSYSRYNEHAAGGPGNSDNSRYSDHRESRFSDNPGRYDDRSNKPPPPDNAPDNSKQAPGVPPSEWPQSLRDYVKRCFANCSSDHEKDSTEQFLKNKLKTTEEDRFIWETDWDNEPTPFGTMIKQREQHRGSPQKVGFSFSRRPNFQPRQNVFHNKPHQHQDRAMDTSSNNSADYGSDSPNPNSNPPYNRNLKSRMGPKKGMFKPGDEAADDGPGHSAGPPAGGSPGGYKQNRRGTYNSFLNNQQQSGPSGIGGTDNNERNNNNNNNSNNSSSTPRGRGRGGRGGRGRGRGRGRGFDNNNNNNNNKKTMKNKISMAVDDSEGGSPSPIGDIAFDTTEKKEGRANRFKKENAISVSDTISSMIASANKMGGEDVHFSDVHIVGTNTALEKPYLRLTSAPTADQVRPEYILVKSLSHIMNKWKKEQNYSFVCEQLKSIRQDLTIQNIKNEFAVKVYECHARIAMEKVDTTEYNQCQTRLIDLYRTTKSGNPLEFLAYRILYYIYINNTSDATKTIAKLKPGQRKAEEVQHAIEVFNAWSAGNYYRFFKLYLIAPKMGGYLMDAYVQRERHAAMKKIIRSYKPTISVRKVSELIGYPDSETTTVYLEELPVVFTSANKQTICCKKTVVE